ncbi:hypothetical protein KP79_PYT21254 [Mizuhopecten yessoensis]|uniref:Uncharacterized protein n=1 Tax=Mizuhopecten yessoensis TaxID=6573 RepID=A0A210QTL4_MIZYE|nr:hypothetical protein KP79_PYT21254 [Mizuhopecten yessoensis]
MRFSKDEMKSDIFSPGPLPQIRLLDMLAVLFMICGMATRTLSKTCLPVNCSPGFQIISCDLDGERDKCELCPQNKVQLYNISSRGDKVFHSCFSAYPDKCKKKGVISSRWMWDVLNCSQPCDCDVANCYAGKTGCDCQKYDPCDVNQQMNEKTGACEPCPSNKYKDERGCYPCLYDLNGTRTQPVQITSPVTATTKEMPNSGDASCVNIIVVIILGSLLFLTVAALFIIMCKRRRDSRTSQLSTDTEENKPISITLIQENSLLLNNKDNNANIARELETAYQCTEVSELDAKRVAAEAPDSGFWSRRECSTSSYPTSHPKNSCQSQNGGISGHCENLSYLLTETPSPTEHDEESTHVKTISGDD